MSVGSQSVQRGDGWYVYSLPDVTWSDNLLGLVLVNDHRRCRYPGIGLVLPSRKSVHILSNSCVRYSWLFPSFCAFTLGVEGREDKEIDGPGEGTSQRSTNNI